ncbi:cell surface hyaluronidase-like [Mercenaria mercenaria]|uniref:cell surface hyaluronidase-like n=1 Tax=Mercenaria mercenaria TaxID=6596 RepID=UPI00234E459C|nr:cell surface hyaluronidase-like [Mercenaria mercenaria]
MPSIYFTVEITFIIQKSTQVVIKEGVLLDVASLDVYSIEIKDEGRLVFNQGHDINIKTRGIFVKNYGQLVIGSDTCRHTDNVHIQLEGTRTIDRKSLGPEGEKFIAVTDNGSLQIHGEDRVAWTKLSGTVERFNASAENVYYRHLDTSNAELKTAQDGFGVHILDADLEFLSYDVFNMPLTVSRVNRGMLKMANKLNEVEMGQVVSISLQNRWYRPEGGDYADFYKIIEELVGMEEGELLLRKQTEFDAFSLLFVVGGSYDQSLDHQIGKREAEAKSSLIYNNKKITAVSHVRPYRNQNSYVDLRVLNPDVGFPEIMVTHDIRSWRAGDEILFTSTDYAFDHGEVRTIKEITGEKSFTITHELNYRHFGEIESGVDMRGEVALLSRNIKISGVMQRGCPEENENCDNKPKHTDTYGGHIKIFDSFHSVVIQGAEMFFMGQTIDEGFYPIHFHMCKNITGKTAVVKRNSIHHTYRRAITIHGTFGTSVEAPGVQLTENVAYWTLGHSFFLEDGAESATILRRNLGAETRNVNNDFVTDRSKATTYWITNPKTVMIDNVAAGSEGFGMWYTFPLEPVGMSKGLAYKYEEAKHTALWTFDNNVVHSNEKGGLNFDFILQDDDGHIAACMRYETRQDPFDENSPGVKVQLNRLTAYKNLDINVWLRGGWFELYQLSSAESKKGLQLARGSTQSMYVTKSIFVGRSEGNSEDSSYPGGITPTEQGQILGTVFHDGPTYFKSCWFTGFDNDDTYISGAIGFAPKQKSESSVVSSVSDMRFGFIDGEGGNRVFDGLVDNSIQGIGEFNVDESATFQDADGSVTRCPLDSEWKGPVQLVKPGVHALTDKCVYRDNWNMAVCNDRYGKVSVQPKGFFPGTTLNNFDQSGQMRRRSFDDDTEIYVEDATNQKQPEYMVMLGRDEYYYEFQYTEEFPRIVRLLGFGVEKNRSVVVGACLPEDVTKDDFKVFIKTPDDIEFGADQMKYVDTMEEVASDTSMRKLYFKDRMVYFRLSSKKVRNEHWDRSDNDHCPGAFCPRVVIHTYKKMKYTPCFTTTDEQMSNSKVMESVEDLDCTLPASEPESDWGARDTLASEDGSWGQWSGWSECCNEAGGDVVERTRYRLCDDPAPRGSGADCSGESIQKGPCPYGCAVDGELSGWSGYSDCYCDGNAVGSTGVRKKIQECVGVANGGKYCKGDVVRYAICRNKCGTRGDDAVDGVLSQWSEWTDCFCDGIAEGSRGASTRTRTCEGTANYGDFCAGTFESVRHCDADCVPDQ